MQKIVDALNGKKTYIVAILIAVLNFAAVMNWISPNHLLQINAMLGALGLGALRAGVAKNNI